MSGFSAGHAVPGRVWFGRMTTSRPGRPAQIDPPTSRFLAWHETTAHSLVGREVRELGDAVMLHDPTDREPFWNRMAGFAWPSAPAAFDRRLAEALALFGVLDRIPHAWPLPGFDEPADLIARLLTNGFEDMGSGIIMVLDPHRWDATSRPEDLPRGLTIEHIERPDEDAAGRLAVEIGAVLADAFQVEPSRRSGVEREAGILLGRPECHVCLVRVDGAPAAVVRRSTFAGASYLSSIGTSAPFRGRGLGRLVTESAVREALAAGSRWTYLGVFTDNAPAKRLYEAIGFVPVGGPSPDLLLRR